MCLRIKNRIREGKSEESCVSEILATSLGKNFECVDVFSKLVFCLLGIFCILLASFSFCLSVSCCIVISVDKDTGRGKIRMDAFYLVL